ncbi:hypothetical protein B0H13DRAFT_2077646, partial [Mycena leptocephala]
MSPYHRRPWSRGYWTTSTRLPALHSSRASHPPPSRVPIHPSTHPHASTKSTLLKSSSAPSSFPPSYTTHNHSHCTIHRLAISVRPPSVHTHPSGARYIHLLLHTRVHICITFSFIHTYILFLFALRSPHLPPRVALRTSRIFLLLVHPHLLDTVPTIVLVVASHIVLSLVLRRY